MNAPASIDMNTITIEDPREAQAQLEQAFPGAMCCFASYGTADIEGGTGWRFSVMYPTSDPRADVQGYGPTIADALKAIEEKASRNDPLEKLQEQAAKLGMKLVPAEA